MKTAIVTGASGNLGQAVIKKFIDENPIRWIIEQAKDVINKRQEIGQTNRTDLLQLMLESASDEDFIQVCTFIFFQNPSIMFYLGS